MSGGPEGAQKGEGMNGKVDIDMDDDDPEKIKEILSVVSTEIPKLIESITKSVYNVDNAQNMAKSVAQFYKSMKEAGMDDKQAFALTQEFMDSFSIGGIIGKAVQGGSDRDDIDEFIEQKVKEKLKEKLKKNLDKECEKDD